MRELKYFGLRTLLLLAAAALPAGCANIPMPPALSADEEAEKAEIATLAKWVDENKVCPGGYRIAKRPRKQEDTTSKRAYHVICTPTTRSA